eukprot:GHVS01059546.1.p4 GENE.GHVS01059546.1~~GHVS01059546.1.p4  ORF type:complete len:126 (-),score=60.69 GHVS01059546.1:250-627(-)
MRGLLKMDENTDRLFAVCLRRTARRATGVLRDSDLPYMVPPEPVAAVGIAAAEAIGTSGNGTTVPVVPGSDGGGGVGSNTSSGTTSKDVDDDTTSGFIATTTTADNNSSGSSSGSNGTTSSGSKL